MATEAFSSAGPAPLGTATNPRPYSWLALAVSLALAYSIAALGSVVTASSVPTWYAGLAKPVLHPPDWLFAPVWAMLYTAMAIAAWLIWRTRRSSCRTRGLRLYAVQLLLNLTWSWLFFSQHRPGLALVEITLLAIGIALTMQSFVKMNYVANGLMGVYLAWVLFAGYLNWGIWRLNG